MPSLWLDEMFLVMVGTLSFPSDANSRGCMCSFAWKEDFCLSALKTLTSDNLMNGNGFRYRNSPCVLDASLKPTFGEHGPLFADIYRPVNLSFCMYLPHHPWI
ncbi:uncharacterized protein BT62DRAFT_1004612 [Guyanagaster necrorhizus]|uniref:Secreted protein n=1 Tax=Guyanagaster necrorhizus TaxID=856835 RepID=A0A9P8ATV8_9AGAR|nr:uncharacterized protein BT62DRAFT_1004612 [Guyanagaster necrorhizus MCA 3950]KAG7447843.1 hypothetical protein BT62DRAFT_1004612 [Guyanagaster necrorhizus MCA 3950]